MRPVLWHEQAQILGRAGRKLAQAPATSVQHVKCAAATTKTAIGAPKASVQSPLAEEVQAESSEKDIHLTVDVNRGSKHSSREAVGVPAPGTPKLATPVKRPVSADLPREAMCT